MRPHERGFRLDGVHSWFDKGIIIPTDPQVYYPSKIKTKERLIGTNTILDVSTSISGVQPFEERRIKITINVLDYGVIKSKNTQHKAMEIMNWLYFPTGQRKIELDIIPHYYFMGELEEGNDFETNLMEYGIAEVFFTCYPYRKSSTRKGDDIFRTFDFKTGSRYKTGHKTLKATDFTTPLKVHDIGSVVHMAPWSQAFVSEGVSGQTTRFQLHQPKVIKSTRVSTTNTNPLVIDKRLYTFESGEEFWAQDILESFVDIETRSPEITIVNDSPVRVKPQVSITAPSSPFYVGIYIKINDQLHLVRRDMHSPSTLATSDTLYLEPGVNKLRLIGLDQTVSIHFREEWL